MTMRSRPPAMTSARTSPDPQGDLKITCMNNLLAAAAERLYFKDLLSRYLLVSASWAAAYAPGRAPEGLTGKTDFDIFTYAHASAAYADEQQIIRTGRPVIEKAEQETYKDRPDAWVLTTKMPLRDERGQIVGTFGITRDITAEMAPGVP